MSVLERQELYNIAVKIKQKAIEYYKWALIVSNGPCVTGLDTNIEELDVMIKELKK